MPVVTRRSIPQIKRVEKSRPPPVILWPVLACHSNTLGSTIPFFQVCVSYRAFRFACRLPACLRRPRDDDASIHPSIHHYPCDVCTIMWHHVGHLGHDSRRRQQRGAHERLQGGEDAVCSTARARNAGVRRTVHRVLQAHLRLPNRDVSFAFLCHLVGYREFTASFVRLVAIFLVCCTTLF